jgi:4,5-DOPA dioxygenase extradiol
MAKMHPADEHFLPLFFALGAKKDGDAMRTIYDGVHYGTLSMRCFALSPADKAAI